MKITDCEVTLIDSMGTDISVVNAARVSFHKESGYLYDDDDPTVMYLSEKDQKLLKFLADHGHIIPFAHAFLSFRLKIPIFIARQLGKHQVGLALSEVSRRYVDDEIEIFVPDYFRPKAENVKQGSGVGKVKVNTYGNGICLHCGDKVEKKTYGPIGKWCSEKCRASFRKENDPDFRIHNAKYNAEKRGIEFSLVRGDIVWPEKCPLLGIPLEYVSTNETYDNAPSIDRIDSTKGYTKDNVWVISNKANRMKNDASKQELINFARKILLTFNGQIVPKESTFVETCRHMVEYYEHLLSEGVAPEQARMILPQNMMTEWIWSGSLLAFIRVCNLRLDAHTQKETQDVAKEIAHHLDMRFPESWKVCKKFNENL